MRYGNWKCAADLKTVNEHRPTVANTTNCSTRPDFITINAMFDSGVDYLSIGLERMAKTAPRAVCAIGDRRADNRKESQDSGLHGPQSCVYQVHKINCSTDHIQRLPRPRFSKRDFGTQAHCNLHFLLQHHEAHHFLLHR